MIKEICFEDILLEGTKEVFETMIFMSVERCPDCVAVEGDSLLGSITFTGDVEGCLTMCYNVNCAKTIACNMLAADPDEDIGENDIRDAIGEISNMAMGSIKALLMSKGIGNLNVSIPCVVSGKELTNSLGDTATKISMSAYVDDEVIELTLQYRADY